VLMLICVVSWGVLVRSGRGLVVLCGGRRFGVGGMTFFYVVCGCVCVERGGGEGDAKDGINGMRGRGEGGTRVQVGGSSKRW